MREKYCISTGKVIHESENAARVALKYLKKSKGYNGHIYVCPDCKFFHVGRVGKRTDRTPIRKKKNKHVECTPSIITIFLIPYGTSALESGEPIFNDSLMKEVFEGIQEIHSRLKT
jgi:hypothetical protein